jgi:hypothetical protein
MYGLFNEEDLEDFDRITMRFDNRIGKNTTSISRTIEDEDATYLPHVLREMVEFLQAAGFTYVEELRACSHFGKVHSSSTESDELEETAGGEVHA